MYEAGVTTNLVMGTDVHVVLKRFQNLPRRWPIHITQEGPKANATSNKATFRGHVWETTCAYNPRYFLCYGELSALSMMIGWLPPTLISMYHGRTGRGL